MTDGPKGPYKELSPGLYLDRDGNAVISPADLLAHLGLPDISENRLEVIETMTKLLLELYRPQDIIVRKPGDPEWRNAAEEG